MADGGLTLDYIYRVMSPRGLSETTAPTPPSDNPTVVKTLNTLLREKLYDPQGRFYLYSAEKGSDGTGYDGIYQSLNAHLTDASNKDQVEKLKKESKALYHILGPAGTKPVDFGDSDYWGGVTDTRVLVNPTLANVKNNFGATLFVTRDPYVNPSTRGTDHVDFFLNYTPPFVAAQMMPYLDVEFEIRKPIAPENEKSLSTPSILRFLLGSQKVSGGALSEADKFMAQASIRSITPKSKDDPAQEMAYSGMEVFLMPQSLTNMDNLGDTTARLTRPKPFTPFASIEGLDIQIQNAGAGKFAHKKGTLKLKVHDKSRLSEMAEFIRGSVGFSQAIVWTTYGWIAPLNQDDIKYNPYANFINESMVMRECWTVINSQFGFDASGQATVNLEMVSKAAKALQEISVGDGPDSQPSQLKEFQKAVDTVSKIMAKYSGEPSFSVSVQQQQVLGAAASNGNLMNLKDINVKTTIENLISSLRNSPSSIPSDEITSLQTSLNKLNGDYSFKAVKEKVADYVKGKFNALAVTDTSPDPFLAMKGRPGEYFPPELVAVIDEYRATAAARNKAQSEAKETAKISIDPKADVVSFGRLFSHFVLPGVAMSDSCDEVQVFFYGLNDQCGPVSGHSIAEFPINVSALAYAYAEAVKQSPNEALNLDAFFKLVIETQFADNRAIGYGMNKLFLPLDPDNAREEKQSQTKDGKAAIEAGMTAWTKRWGAFKIPMIEMYVETGTAGSLPRHAVDNLKRGAADLANSKKDSSQGKIIKRIHIYDKQNNPYKLAQQVFDGGGGPDKPLVVGEIDTPEIEAQIKSFLSKLKEENKAKYKETVTAMLNALKKEGATYKDAIEASGFPKTAEQFQFEVVKKPGKDDIKIPRDRKAFKDALKRSVPTLSIGTNGSLISTANVASKTDGLQGSINLINSLKSDKGNKATAPANALEEAGNLPLRTVPVSLSMTTQGVPIAQLYQTFFVDFDTGTSLDNLYSCNQLTHNISQGKFQTVWNFIYTNGYGKFSMPQTAASVATGQMKQLLIDAGAESNKHPAAKKSGAAKKK
jgi:hypothetical protein